VDIVFRKGDLTPHEQRVVSKGFSEHSELVNAPAYAKERINWLVRSEQNAVLAILTADTLWDWLYVDELWMQPHVRGSGLGRQLMKLAEEFATSEQLQGIWLWTQSWQAEGFYKTLNYVEFTRFDNFPRGHSRIGFRKVLNPIVFA
jgi:GNAT superfamily N-acetyltransferase